MSLDRVDGSKGYYFENCRWATRVEQNLNQRIRSDNTSGVKGICWKKSNNSWVVKFKGKHIGYFKKISEAIKARKRAEYEKS